MFVAIGFDDNKYSGLNPDSNCSGLGMKWITDFFRHLRNPGNISEATFDGIPVRATFFVTTKFIEKWYEDSPTYVKRAWRQAVEDGHEINPHGHNHFDGSKFNESRWEEQIEKSLQLLSQPFKPDESIERPDSSAGIGIARSEMVGFRSPFLHYSPDLFKVLQSKGFLYDASIASGSPWRGANGYELTWPYTVDFESPDYRDSCVACRNFSSEKFPELWEMPAYRVIQPPDNLALEYGIEPGLRNRTAQHLSEPNWEGFTGPLDWNLWYMAKMTKTEFLATLKYTLDIRLRGNRAPMLFGAHTDIYCSTHDNPSLATAVERRQALEEFILYAISKPEVRFVPYRSIINWMKHPTRLQERRYVHTYVAVPQLSPLYVMALVIALLPLLCKIWKRS